jgi:hypothetical protein
MPDPALTAVMRQLAASTGMTVRIVHPGKLREAQSREAFSGLADEALDHLASGEPHIALENDDLMIRIEREIVAAMIQSSVRHGHTGCWAAFASPDGQVDVVLPLSGENVVHGPFAHGRAA